MLKEHRIRLMDRLWTDAESANSDDCGLLADLLMDANTQQFQSLFPTLASHSDDALVELENELAKVVHPEWPDSKNNFKQLIAPEELRIDIQNALGMVRGGFAFCQRLRYEELPRILPLLDRYGYRPLSIRPYVFEETTFAAIAWTRDECLWNWIGNADAQTIAMRDRDLIRDGYAPIDVSVYPTKEGPRFTAIWAKQDPLRDSKRRIMIHTPECEMNDSMDYDLEQPQCTSFSLALDERGHPFSVGIWGERHEHVHSSSRLFHGLLNDFRADDFPGFFLEDARLYASENCEKTGDELQISALWNVSTKYESQFVCSLAPEEQLESGQRLIAVGFRPRSACSLISSASESQTCLSIWYRPLICEKAKDRLAKRQANAAVALLKMNRSENVWPILKHRPDPRARSYLVHRCSPLNVSPASVADELDRQKDCSTRRALILVLGEYSEQQLHVLDRAMWTSRLLDNYESDPDPGIHSAIAWTLRQWGLQSKLHLIDQRLSTGKLEGNQSLFLDHATTAQVRLSSGSSESEVVSDQKKRPLRGATLAHPPETVRNSFIDGYPPNVGVYGVGFRLIRSMVADHETESGLEMGYDQRMVLRGTGSMSPAALTRSSYRIMQNPHFPLFAWGFRAARTLGAERINWVPLHLECPFLTST